jgi:predicted MFS family arabinose efflux permease
MVPSGVRSCDHPTMAATRPALTAVRAALVAPAVVLFLALLAAQAAVLVLTPILVEVARDFGVSTSTAGQVRTLTGLVAGVAALAFGRTLRGVALRDLLLGGAALLALGSLLSAAAPTFAVFVVAQIPIGVAVAVLVSAGAAAAGEWAQPDGRTRLLSSTLLGPPVAWVIGMPLVGIAAERSWRLGFLVFPLVASVVVALALSMCRKERLPAVRPLVRLRDLLGDPTVGGWALAELLASSAWAGTLVYAGALFVESFDASPTLTGFVLAGAAVAYLPGNLVASRILRARSALDVLPVISALGAAGMLAFGAVRPSTFVSALLFAALAFVMAARTLAGGVLGLEMAPERRLAVMGLRAAALQFGYLIGSAGGGVALVLGGYPALGALLGSLCAAAAAAYLLLRTRIPGRIAATA